MADHITQDIYVIVLAAGKGTRMKSKLHKVLHPLAGKPMIGHVLDNVEALQPKGIFVIVGHEAQQLKDWAAEDGRQITWVHQAEQLGTAHAVQTALPYLNESGAKPNSKVLIISGDVPLTQTLTFKSLCQVQTEFSLLTQVIDNPHGYGRILRDENGVVTGIVEEKDATSEQRAVKEINTNVMVLNKSLLEELLPKVSNNNAQQEYYLPDLVGLAAEKNEPQSRVEVIVAPNDWEVQGVNDRVQLEALERLYQRNYARALMVEGVTIADASRIDIRGELKAGVDCTLDINVVIEGKVVLGDNVKIGQNVRLKNVVIGDNVEINAFCDIADAEIAQNCNVGPFARVRPGSKLAEGARLGNFVETKNAVIGEGAKINHLSYAGDCEIGRETNIGAGTIFCNYDGVNKHKTIIGEGVFIGSNSSLVAPLNIAQGATVGAGSTLTQDVPESALAVARAKPRIINGWKRPTKKN